MCLLLFVLATLVSISDPDPISLNGHWQQIGYGRIVEISDEQVVAYDHCAVSCVSAIQIDREMLPMFGEVIRQTKDSFTLKQGITEYDFVRLEALPEDCVKKNKDRNNPIHNFESVWHTFNEQYCYFNEREVDWHALGEKYRNRIHSKTSNLDLFLVIEEMLGEINDGHINFSVPDKLEKQYLKVKDKNNGSNNPKPTVSSLRSAVRKGVIDNYLESVKIYHHGLVRWGQINSAVGYIQINAMDGFANFDVSPNLEYQDFWRAYFKIADQRPDYFSDVVSGTRMIMDSVISDLASTQAIVLDVRFNGGGIDDASLEILSHFIDNRLLAFTKKARVDDGYSRDQKIFIEPAGQPYKGELYILCSPESASATEILVLASLNMPDCVRIGSNTESVFSDMLQKQMPNGWTYSLSNEVYESVDGKNYEHIGIPADIDLRYARDTRQFYESIIQHLNDGHDEAVEVVLKKYQ